MKKPFTNFLAAKNFRKPLRVASGICSPAAAKPERYVVIAADLKGQA